MPTPSMPAEVRRLLDERASARAERDFARADALRGEIAALGWEVQDAASGSTARPILARGPTTPAELPLGAPAVVEASIQVVADDHPDDLLRCLRGLAAYPSAASREFVIVDNAASFDVDAVIADADAGLDARVVRSEERLGWADSRTLGMRHSSGEVTVLLDTSLEPTGDFLPALVATFEDPSVGIAGGWGVTTRDGRQFEEAPTGEVDAVEGYCLAVRRDVLRAVGGFDPRYRFYRNADLDFSFTVRAAGWRAVRVGPLPLVRHEHRGWVSLPDAERDRLSRRNFYRFLDRWRDRTDLFGAGRDDR